MNERPHTTAVGRQATLSDIEDLIWRAKSIVELINMASEADIVPPEAGNPIAWGCVHVETVLSEASAIIAKMKAV